MRSARAAGRDAVYRAKVTLTRVGRRRIENPREAFGNSSDRYWYWLVSRGVQLAERLHGVIPGLPGEEMQRNWTGSAGHSTLYEAFGFYRLVKERSRAHRRDIRPETRILDFGCGWGRIIRFFLRDVDHWNLYGCDCHPEALGAAREGSRWGQFILVDPMPPSPFKTESFDVVYLYSVFSHLSEQAHLEWLREFRRILRPGGLVFATTRKRSFIEDCATLRARSTVPAFAAGGAASFLETEDALRRYDAGQFCHSPTGGGRVLKPSYYGETCIPESYVRREWGKLFEVLDFLGDDPRFPQAMAVLHRA